jgi:hypothetical protein
MTMHSYEIKIIGSLGPATREAFADLVVEVEPTITILSGDLDQSSLHEVLDRVRALGLELVEIKQAPHQPDRRPALVHAIRQAPELGEFDAERHDAVERAVQGRLVHLGRQHRIGAIGFDTEITERLTADLSQTADDGNPVAVRAHRPLRLDICGRHGTIYAHGT